MEEISGPVVLLSGDCVQHADHRCGTDPCADERDRSVAFLKYEVTVRYSRVYDVSDFEAIVQVARHDPVRPALDADPVSTFSGTVRQGKCPLLWLVEAIDQHFDRQMLSGFEILYAAVELSTLVAGLQALITLGIAMTGAYLMSAPSMEPEE